MKWITKENAKVDRVACPWLIVRFLDTEAEFFFVPKEEVLERAQREGAIPYDVPDSDLYHDEGSSTFETFLTRYGLTANAALVEMGKIVHAADVPDDLGSAPEGAGLMAIAYGFADLLGDDDERKLELELPLYDALYAWCQRKLQTPRG